MSRTLKILLTLAIILAGGGLLLRSSMSEAEYFKHVDQVLSDGSRFENKTLKVHGFVEAGSIVEEIRDQTTHRTFVLEHAGKRIRVNHDSL